MKRKTALISVTHKDGIVSCAQRLVALNFEIVASGGTADLISKSGVAVTPTTRFVNRYASELLKKHGVEITPEIETALSGAILGHRVATISRDVDGGLLAKPQHIEELAKYMMTWIDLVIVDFYPFEKTVSKPGVTFEEIIDNIDVGGPHMAHSAAKGAAHGRIIINDPNDRGWVLDGLEQSPDHDLDQATKEMLAAKADYSVGRYCLAVAEYRSGGKYSGFTGKQTLACKYGENAHQKPAALFSSESSDPLALDKFKVISGDEPSYNNICDLDRLLQTMTHVVAAMEVNGYPSPYYIALGAKHGNMCGAAIAEHPKSAVEEMLGGDETAIYGGLIMTNFPFTEECAEKCHVMLDGVIAPSIEPAAIEKLKRKTGKCRFIVNEALAGLTAASLDTSPRYRNVRGGFLKQPNYMFVIDFKNPELKQYGEDFFNQQKIDLLLAWAIGSTSNSNTITLVRNGVLIGNGVGQQDRVGAASLAITRAQRSGHTITGAAAYSDSFFPFPDGPKYLIAAGVGAILTSSGSIRDNATIEACSDAGVLLIMVPDSLGRGFFGH